MTSPSPAKFQIDGGHGRGGFTLVELVVAVTIAAIVVVMLTLVLSRSMALSQRNSGSMTAFASASAAIDLIATDLASVAVTRQPYEYLQARPEDATSLANSSNFGSTLPMRLMFTITSAADSVQSSSPPPSPSPIPTPYYPDSEQVHAVCYRLAYQNPIKTTNTANAVFGLYRQAATAADTFAYALGVTDLYTAMYGGNMSSIKSTPPPSTFVAANVVDLQVAIYASFISTGGTGNAPAGSLTQPTVIINPVGGATAAQPYQRVQVWGTQNSVNNNVSSSSPTPAPSPAGYGPAAYAEVSLTVVEDAGAKLWGNGQNTSANSPASLRQKYGHTLTRKVLLRMPN